MWSSEEGQPATPESSETVAVGNLWDQEEGGRPPQPATGESSNDLERIWQEPPPPPPRPAEPSGDDGAPSPDGEARDESRRAKRASVPRRIFRLVVVLLLFGLLADGVYVSLTLASSMYDFRESLSETRTAFAEGDMDRAEALLDDAREAVETADSTRRHPAFLVGTVAPDVRAIDQAIDASLLATSAGERGLETARTLGVEEGTITEGLYSDGRLNLAGIDDAYPLVREASESLDEAVAAMDGAPDPLIPLVEDALAEARSDLGEAASTARNGELLFGVLPDLLGNDGTRSYLLAFQALGEARGTGGVAGVFGVLRVDDGEIALGEIAPYADIVPLSNKDPVQSPTDWYRDSYEGELALQQWPQANLTPDFPTAAEVMLRMYEQGAGRSLDGALAIDPVTVAELLEATGPLQVGGLDTEVNADNAVQVLTQDIYTEFQNEDRQNKYLADLVEEFWGRVREGDLDGPTFAAAIGEVSATKHLKVYSTDGDTQEALESLGVDGDPTADQEMTQMVFDNNYAANKLDVFVTREIDMDIRLDAEGDARITTTVSVQNGAPAGEGPSLLLGGILPDGPAAGVSRQQMNILLPQDAQPETYVRPNGQESGPLLYEDDGRQVVWDFLDLNPGDEKTISTTYFVPEAAEISADEGGVFTMFLEPQARAVPDTYSVTVQAPDGMVISSSEGGNKRKFSSEGTLNETTRIHVEIAPPD